MAIKVTGIYTVCTGFSDYLEKNMNKYSWYVIALLASPIISADQHQMDHSLHENHGHTGHSHQQAVDGAKLDVNPEKFDRFVEDLTYAKVAVISVQGMVCDFCARGIDKTFKKDTSVLKVDVDLNKGKVLVAYKADQEIDFDDVKHKIQSNGQNATDIQLVSI
jgi:copper chaperone CopZ